MVVLRYLIYWPQITDDRAAGDGYSNNKSLLIDEWRICDAAICQITIEIARASPSEATALHTIATN